MQKQSQAGTFAVLLKAWVWTLRNAGGGAAPCTCASQSHRFKQRTMSHALQVVLMTIDQLGNPMDADIGARPYKSWRLRACDDMNTSQPDVQVQIAAI